MKRITLKKLPKITWKPIEVDIRKVRPTPKNYKIKTDLGRERLTQSLEMFGLASTVVCNTDLSLIDGNSRLEQARERGEKKIWVSVPNRKLTPKEYVEMSAMYDFAKAGDIDMERIEGDLGTKEDFYKKWNLEVPMHLLDKLGNGFKPDSKGSKIEEGGKGKKAAVSLPDDVFLVQLFFNEKEETEFRKLEEKLKVKFKATSTTELVLKVFRKA